MERLQPQSHASLVVVTRRLPHVRRSLLQHNSCERGRLRRLCELYKLQRVSFNCLQARREHAHDAHTSMPRTAVSSEAAAPSVLWNCERELCTKPSESPGIASPASYLHKPSADHCRKPFTAGQHKSTTGHVADVAGAGMSFAPCQSQSRQAHEHGSETRSKQIQPKDAKYAKAEAAELRLASTWKERFPDSGRSAAVFDTDW